MCEKWEYVVSVRGNVTSAAETIAFLALLHNIHCSASCQNTELCKEIADNRMRLIDMMIDLLYKVNSFAYSLEDRTALLEVLSCIQKVKCSEALRDES